MTFNADEVFYNNNLSLYADHVAVNGASRGTLTWRTDGAAPTATFAAGTGTLIFEQSNGGRTLGIGGGTAQTVLSAATVAQIRNGFDNYIFGKADGGDIYHHVTTWDAPVTFRTGADFVNAAAVTSAGTFRVEAGGDVNLQQGIISNAAGLEALVLSAGGDFINSVGANALQAANGRWLVYSTDPMANTRGGLIPNAVEFGKTLASDAPATIAAGNHLLYSTSVKPVVTLAAADKTITEGDAFPAGTLNYVSGFATGDSLSNIGLSGSPVYNTTYTIGNPAGTYAITASAGTLASLLGYQFAFDPGILTVLPASSSGGGGGATPTPQLPPSVEYRMQHPMAEEMQKLTHGTATHPYSTTYSNDYLLSIDPRLKEQLDIADEQKS